jgi:hypothetical protein
MHNYLGKHIPDASIFSGYEDYLLLYNLSEGYSKSELKSAYNSLVKRLAY